MWLHTLLGCFPFSWPHYILLIDALARTPTVLLNCGHRVHETCLAQYTKSRTKIYTYHASRCIRIPTRNKFHWSHACPCPCPCVTLVTRPCTPFVVCGSPACGHGHTCAPYHNLTSRNCGSRGRGWSWGQSYGRGCGQSRRRGWSPGWGRRLSEDWGWGRG